MPAQAGQKAGDSFGGPAGARQRRPERDEQDTASHASHMISPHIVRRLPEPVTLLGVDVVPFESYEQALACIEEAIESGKKSFWVAINPEKIYRAWQEPRLLDVLRQADVGICDGVGVSIASKVLHGHGLPRCTGCDLFFRLMPLAAEKGWGVFLLGASPDSNEGACRNLLRTYPGLRIVGRQDGYLHDSAEVVREINASRADLLFVAMGSPWQEFWIAEHRERLGAVFCLGVGGSIDVASGKARRAPELFQKTGTEWLFQSMRQPWRWKRQFMRAAFILKVLKTKLTASLGRLKAARVALSKEDYPPALGRAPKRSAVGNP